MSGLGKFLIFYEIIRKEFCQRGRLIDESPSLSLSPQLNRNYHRLHLKAAKYSQHQVMIFSMFSQLEVILLPLFCWSESQQFLMLFALRICLALHRPLLRYLSGIKKNLPLFLGVRLALLSFDLGYSRLGDVSFLVESRRPLS